MAPLHHRGAPACTTPEQRGATALDRDKSGGMWVNKTRLPHVLAPGAYHDPAHHERELAELFRPGWHGVGSLDDIPRDGDFFTTEVLGQPLIVRNHRGEPRAFLNVCAHRHTLLTHAERGSAPRLRCQYHGWEYDGDGAVCKIPDAGCFVPVRRGGERLRARRVATLGKLLFVSLADEGPGLRAWLGERAWAMGEEAFGWAARQSFATTMEHPCNWKIPLENVLESYHVPSLHDNFIARHPRLFRLFQGERGGGGESHELGDGFTAVHDELGAESALYRGVIERLRPGASVEFVHLHAFPNVLLGKTSLVSFFQATHPVTPTTSRSTVRLFLDLGQRDRGPLERLAAPLADRLVAALCAGLMSEDTPVFPDVQRGMAASPQPGVLGSREERIHHFHTYLAARAGTGEPAQMAGRKEP
jgi:choline monooxygenase